MHPAIKSYVIRAGRVSKRQQQGLDQWLSAFELAPTATPWCFSTVFGREANTVVEVGFGMGSSLLTMAKNNPNTNYVGIEVHRAGVGSLAADLHEAQLTSVKIVLLDAAEIFKLHLADNTLAGVQIFFPDPWHKKRHHKRRIIQAEFVALVTKKLQPGGFIHCATDIETYAEQMLEVLSACPGLQNTQVSGGFTPRPDTRPVTKFEQRGQRLGHGVWDLVFVKA